MFFSSDFRILTAEYIKAISYRYLKYVIPPPDFQNVMEKKAIGIAFQLTVKFSEMHYMTQYAPTVTEQKLQST